jgi:Raf kinase inhibitor-like YbhB/YbcL family protein
MADFRIWSDDFPANGFMPKASEFDDKSFGVDGENISPALQWEAPPADAQSLALTVFDPDAHTGSGFWHWVVVNIPLDARALPRNAGKADGSLLPHGAVTPDTTNAVARLIMHQNEVDSTTYTGLYELK